MLLSLPVSRRLDWICLFWGMKTKSKEVSSKESTVKNNIWWGGSWKQRLSPYRCVALCSELYVCLFCVFVGRVELLIWFVPWGMLRFAAACLQSVLILNKKSLLAMAVTLLPSRKTLSWRYLINWQSEYNSSALKEALSNHFPPENYYHPHEPFLTWDYHECMQSAINNQLNCWLNTHLLNTSVYIIGNRL